MHNTLRDLRANTTMHCIYDADLIAVHSTHSSIPCHRPLAACEPLKTTIVSLNQVLLCLHFHSRYQGCTSIPARRFEQSRMLCRVCNQALAVLMGPL